MATTKSTAVRARQAAMDKLLAAQREQIEKTADAAVEAQTALAQRAELAEQLEAVEARFKAAIAALVDLGQSHEQIAQLVDVDVSVVRAARRARSDFGPVPTGTVVNAALLREARASVALDGETHAVGETA